MIETDVLIPPCDTVMIVVTVVILMLMTTIMMVVIIMMVIDECLVAHTVSQEERSIFWEVIVSVILSKKLFMYMCPIPDGFQDRVISLYSSKLLIRKRYYILFLILAFIFQVKKLVQFTYYNTFPKILPSTSMHFVTRVKTWCVACLYSEIALSRKPFRIGHMHIYTFLLRMTDTMTPQNIDLSSWNNMYTYMDTYFVTDN
jgi:hypothetical protein